MSDGIEVNMGGILTGVKKLSTKSGQFMSILTVEDVYGSIECVMFPKIHEKYRNKIEQDDIVEIKGRLQLREGREPSITIDYIEPIIDKKQVEETKSETVKGKREYLGLKITDDTDIDELSDILSAYSGDIEVYIKKGGATFKGGMSIRKCNGLVSELLTMLDESDILFFEK